MAVANAHHLEQPRRRARPSPELRPRRLKLEDARSLPARLQLPTARPVLKWAGGKSKLAGSVLPLLPERIGTYFEPFVGGGAIFFALAAEGRFERAVLSDQNPELVAVYRALVSDVEGLIRALRRFKHDEEEYYRVRATRPRSLVGRAARVIYLNKTGFNGLYRVNRSGQFNVPFGRYKNPTICDAENLRAASHALSHAEIIISDFEDTVRSAGPGDAVYFDPPYMPLSRTSSFTAYHSQPFDLREHERLADVFAGLAQRGVTAVLSNSDTPDTRRLYQDFSVATLQVARPINSNAKKRGAVSEILVSAG